MLLEIKLSLMFVIGIFGDKEPNIIIPQVPEPLKTYTYTGKETRTGNRDISQIQQGIIKCNDNQEVICYIIHNNGNIEFPPQGIQPHQIIETHGYEILEDGIYFW